MKDKEWAGDPLVWFHCFYTGLGIITPVYVSWNISTSRDYYSIKPCPISGQGNWSKVEYEVQIYASLIKFIKNGKLERIHSYSAAQSAYLAGRGGNQLDLMQGTLPE